MKDGKPVIVIDAGGTNFRSAVARFDGENGLQIEKFEKKPMPGIGNEIGKEEFFDTIASYLDRLSGESDSIGFCFSYPMTILPSLDGRLNRFCKEIRAREVEGHLIGEGLMKALRKRGHTGIRRIVLLNDATATLLAGKSTALSASRYDSYIGFILGTGMNCCYLETHIPKLGPEFSGREQIVVLESGSYRSKVRGLIDEQFDSKTLDPGYYTFEKMFSGGYIGGIALATLKTAASDGLFGSRAAGGLNGIAELSTRDLDFFLKDPRNPSHLLGGILKGADERDYELVYRILDSFTERAALFTAATMSAAVLKADKGADPSRPVCITLEGTTYYETKNIRNRTEYYLKSFLEKEKGRFTEICKVDSSSLKGAAIAAMMGKEELS